MTYNVRRPGRRDTLGWRVRHEGIARYLREQAPDLVGIQEATPRMLRDLDDALGGYARLGGEREDPLDEEPNVLYYDPRRLRALDAGMFWLSRRPLRRGSKSWGAWHPRTAIWALFEHRRSKGHLMVLNTHLDHVSSYARRRAGQLLHAAAPEGVILGDFNAAPGGAVHTTMLDGRRDPLAGGRATYNAFTGRNRARLDWILVPKELEVKEARIDDPRLENGRPLSDHRPVVAVLAPPPRLRAPAPPSRWSLGEPVPLALPPLPEGLAVAGAISQP